jgi:hypothetical protein
MPGLILFDLKRLQVDIHSYLDLAFQILRYPPRVPADAASPVLELPGIYDLARFINNFKRRFRDSLSVPLCTEVIQYSSLPLQPNTN